MTSKNININLFKYATEEDDLFSDKDSLILSKKISKRSKESDKKEKTKKKLWTEAEDKLLLELIAQYGQKWTIIGKLIGDRKCKQVRDRYLNYLNPEVKTTPFTAEEDAQLISLFNKLGNKWKQIATNMKGRSESQVKNRYYRHLKQLLSSSEGSPFEMSKLSSICSNSTEATEQNDEEEEEEEALDFSILNKEVQNIYFPTFEEQEQEEEKPSYSCFQTEFFRNENFLEEFDNHFSEELSLYQTGAIKDLSSFENKFISAQNLIFGDDEEIQIL